MTSVDDSLTRLFGTYWQNVYEFEAILQMCQLVIPTYIQAPVVSDWLEQVTGYADVEALKNVLTKYPKAIDDRLYGLLSAQAYSIKLEVETGFPRLFAQAVIALWSNLEILVDDLAFLAASSRWVSLTSSVFDQIQVKVSEVEGLDRDDYIRLVLKKLQEKKGSEWHPGVAGFEAYLEPLGLAGTVKADAKRDLIELKAVRNILVHLGGVVDAKFVKACPWRQAEIGQTIKMDAEMYGRFRRAADGYVRVIERRVDMLTGRQSAVAAPSSPDAPAVTETDEA